MLNIPNKIENNGATADGRLSAAEFNSLKNELSNAVTRSGQTLDSGSVLQLAESLFLHGTKAGTFQAAGTVDAIQITPVSGASGVTIPDTYDDMDGVRVLFRPTGVNTTAVTLDIGQTAGTMLGAKDLLLPDGTALTGSELDSTRVVECRYDSTLSGGSGAWQLTPWSLAQAQISLPLSIGNGGTGAIDAAGARTGLGVPPNTRQITGAGLAAGSGGSLESDRQIDVPIATEPEATAGALNNVAMTPLRVANAINAPRTQAFILNNNIALRGRETPSNTERDLIVINGSNQILVGNNTNPLAISSGTSMSFLVEGNDAIEVTGNGGVALAFADGVALRTINRTTGNNVSGGEVIDASGVFRSLGYNVMANTIQNGNFALNKVHAGRTVERTTSAAQTITLGQDANIPDGATVVFLNTGSGADTVVSRGGGVSLLWYRGDGAAVANGDRTIARSGIVTFQKVSLTVYRIWGIGIT